MLGKLPKKCKLTHISNQNKLKNLKGAKSKDDGSGVDEDDGGVSGGVGELLGVVIRLND